MKFLRTAMPVLLVAALVSAMAGQASAIDNAEVYYDLFYLGNGSLNQQVGAADPMPAGGNTPGTNQWKYIYLVKNNAFASGLNQWYAFFNSDNVLRSNFPSLAIASPADWTPTYFAPSAGNNNWKERWRTSVVGSYIPLNGSLDTFAITFTWIGADIPGTQNFDAISVTGSFSGVTKPNIITPVNSSTWGKIKALYK